MVALRHLKYFQLFLKEILSLKVTSIGSGNPNASISGKPSSNEKKDAGGYVVSNVKDHN